MAETLSNESVEVFICRWSAVSARHGLKRSGAGMPEMTTDGVDEVFAYRCVGSASKMHNPRGLHGKHST